jgi:hypothetical protein
MKNIEMTGDESRQRVTRCLGRVVGTSVVYLGGPGFKPFFHESCSDDKMVIGIVDRGATVNL